MVRRIFRFLILIMNLSDTISDIFDQGAVSITIGRKPQSEEILWIQCQVVVKTGPGDGDRMQCVVQTEGRDIVTAFQRCRQQIAHVIELQPLEKAREP